MVFNHQTHFPDSCSVPTGLSWKPRSASVAFPSDTPSAFTVIPKMKWSSLLVPLILRIRETFVCLIHGDDSLNLMENKTASAQARRRERWSHRCTRDRRTFIHVCAFRRLSGLLPQCLEPQTASPHPTRLTPLFHYQAYLMPPPPPLR